MTDSLMVQIITYYSHIMSAAKMGLAAEALLAKGKGRQSNTGRRGGEVSGTKDFG